MKTFTRTFALLLGLVLLVGCTTKMSSKDVAPSSVHHLQRGQRFYVVMPLDGKYKEKTYAGSGRQVSQYFKQALSSYASDVVIGQVNPDDRTTIFAEAAKVNAKYALVPNINHWEPRAAAWSGMAPESNITYEVYDVESGKVLMYKVIVVKGRTMTFKSQHIDELSRIAIQNSCSELF
ncbi:MAG: DUF4823 domain-containing protein [Desulfovibrio sp.]|jgi:hypothetical protein|nr:DUF4823 domain-containing protein [Desulfovibrio sp.]